MNEFASRLDSELFFKLAKAYARHFGKLDEEQIKEFFIQYLREGVLPSWIDE